VDVEEQEDCPAESVSLDRCEAGAAGGGRRAQTVELNGERYVDDHCQQVRDGQRRENAVGRAGRHVWTRQNDHVEHVSDDADSADDEAGVAVVGGVPDRVPAQQRDNLVGRRSGPVLCAADPRRRRAVVRCHPASRNVVIRRCGCGCRRHTVERATSCYHRAVQRIMSRMDSGGDDASLLLSLLEQLMHT